MSSTAAFGLVLVAQCLLLHTSEAATAMQILPKNPDHPGKCFVPQTGSVHEVGSRWSMEGGECGVISCEQWSGTHYLSYATCASVAAAPPCRLVVNASAAYPYCCPRYDCSRLVAEADAKENEVDTGEDEGDDGDVMYMSGSHPAVDYESVQYDVDLGADDSEDGVEVWSGSNPWNHYDEKLV